MRDDGNRSVVGSRQDRWMPIAAALRERREPALVRSLPEVADLPSRRMQGPRW